MKNSFKNIIVFIGFWAILSCQKDQPLVPEPVLGGELHFHFENTVNQSPLVFESLVYINANNDTFSVSLLKYFVSNIKLTNTFNNQTFKVSESYHFINTKEPETEHITLKNVPDGTYNMIEISVGIDSANNNHLSRQGDIDPGTNMFWEMDGYRFLSFEGKRKNGLGIIFHLGGNINYKTLTYNLSEPLVVKGGKISEIHYKVELLELFQNPNTIDFQVTNNVMDPSEALIFSENYANGMFKLHNIINP